ncbi:hypothetical protein Bca52824_015994 [Brassica carinata]|uniref:Uncharacterized protein n=1 Tax=Brassica carinata TaxID=52824 RepID=A0A8X7W4B8_BRACI|nr:hypothetical protein Bca52824_015994 [Brassica carinata]
MRRETPCDVVPLPDGRSSESVDEEEVGFGFESGLDTQKWTTVPSFKSMVTGRKPDLLKPDLTKLTLTKWSADWRGATELYEQAANGFRASSKYERAKVALEKASKGQEMQASMTTRLGLRRWREMEAAVVTADERRTQPELSNAERPWSQVKLGDCSNGGVAKKKMNYLRLQ